MAAARLQQSWRDQQNQQWRTVQNQKTAVGTR
jgi:hypothetical protein